MKALEVRGLRKSFRDADGTLRTVVDVASLDLDAGEQIALEGVSGGGKTTFLHLISGILAADEGRIAISGREMTGLPEPARDRLRAETIGYVFQSFHLIQGLTALENVELGMAFGSHVNRGRATELLRRVGLGGKLSRRPAALSVGEQQRVAVARAMANRPRLVLADEPTGSLDRGLAVRTMALMRDLCLENDAALLVVTHDPAMMEGFSRVDRLERINAAAVPA